MHRIKIKKRKPTLLLQGSSLPSGAKTLLAPNAGNSCCGYAAPSAWLVCMTCDNPSSSLPTSLSLSLLNACGCKKGDFCDEAHDGGHSEAMKLTTPPIGGEPIVQPAEPKGGAGWSGLRPQSTYGHAFGLHNSKTKGRVIHAA